jgi:hypothetical protein
VRLIKLAIISIVFIFLIALAFSLLIPSHIRISKAINVHGNRDSVFALIGNRDRWPEWHPAFLPASGLKFPEITISRQTRNDSEIVMQLQQAGKPPVVNGWKLFDHPEVDSLTVQWYMDFKLGWYPWKKFGSLFYENTYGQMMEQGLGNIKRLTAE